MSLQQKQIKICDECKKELTFGEWCLYHFKKRRDFCSKKCFKSFLDKYFEVTGDRGLKMEKLKVIDGEG